MQTEMVKKLGEKSANELKLSLNKIYSTGIYDENKKIFDGMSPIEKLYSYCENKDEIKDVEKAYIKYKTHVSKSMLTGIKKVIFNGCATIVVWVDGSKTVVKLMEGDDYDPEKAIMMCVMEKMIGSKGGVKRFFKKWIPEEDTSELIEHLSVTMSEFREHVSNIAKSIAKSFEKETDKEKDK